MKRKWHLVIFGIVVLICMGAYYSSPDRSVPLVLQGHWVTDDPRYYDCFIRIEEDFVDIGANAGKGLFGVVQEVSADTRTDHTDYVITYHDNQGLVSFLSLRYEPNSNGILRLANQKNISWRKMSTLTP